MLSMLLLGLLTSSAGAGTTVVDFELRTRLCPEVSTTLEYRLTKTLGEVTVARTLTETEYRDLVQAADYSTCSTFAAEATSTLSTWYTSLGSTDAENLCRFFQVIADAD